VGEARPGDVLSDLGRQLDSAATDVVKPVPGWLDLWRAAADAASEVVQSTLAELPSPNEPAVARDVVAALPDGAQLVVSSSMPIRDVERYAAPRSGLRLLANRGANGIDGVVSTAVGAALARPTAPTGLLLGDLAFLHDSNGLLGAAQRHVDLVCVVVDNDGGGIFSFLPQARQLPEARFEALFGTPHGLDLVALAAAYGVPARPVGGPTGTSVTDAVAAAATEGGIHVLVVRTDRTSNVEAHRRLDDAIAAAVEQVLA
jgi:2-succinyl-5-enolpyruvyl-6-hydroxy-3-cyclohexene-1-carboxylate synthase